MKKLLAFVGFLLFATPAFAQNVQCPTRPPGDSTNACASTAFVSGVFPPPGAAGLPLVSQGPGVTPAWSPNLILATNNTSIPVTTFQPDVGGVDRQIALFLDRPYGAVGDSLDITFGGGNAGVNSPPRSGAISLQALSAGNTGFVFYNQIAAGDAYSTPVGALSSFGLTGVLGLIQITPFNTQATLQIGTPGVTTNSYIDFHSDAANANAGVRLIAHASTALQGSGTLDCQCTFNITPGGGGVQQGLTVLQNPTGTRPAASQTDLNLITIQSENVNVPISGGSAGSIIASGVVMNVGGAVAQGSRLAFYARVVRATPDSNTSLGDDIGLGGSCLATTANGGTNNFAGSRGTCFGASIGASLLPGANFWFSAVGAEIDMYVDPAASVRIRAGWDVASVGSEKGHGYDVAYSVRGVGAGSGWKVGLGFSAFNLAAGGLPVDPTVGVLIGTDGIDNAGGVGTWTYSAASLIDVRNWTFSGYILNATNFVVSGAGAITTGSWAGTAIPATNGGTGQTVYAVGDLLYASTTTALSKLADVATGNALISGGVGVAPSWGKITLASLATQAANTVLGNATSGAAVPTALAMTSCSTAASAVNYTTNTGFGCNTSITAAAVPVSGITGLGTGVATALAVNVGTAGSFVVNGGVLGTPSSGTATNLSGTAASLTAGTATNAVNSGITNDTATNATMDVVWVTANTGNLPLKVTSTKLTFNPSTGALASTTFNGATLAAPQVTVLTSGTGATYSTPAGATRLEVEGCGPGGGGAGSGTTPGAGGNGSTATLFGSALYTGNVGLGGVTAAGNTGGTATGANDNITGATGQSAGTTATGPGGAGGSSFYGGAGGAPFQGAAGNAAAANSCGGGSGGSANGTATGGGGGGAGGFFRGIITSPSASYTYTIGTGGAAGTAGTSGFTGGAGADGRITVRAYFNFLLKRDLNPAANDNVPLFLNVVA